MIRVIARIAAGVVTILLVCASAAQACSVCFNVEESTLVDGTKAGVWFMLAIIVAVQVAFVSFFLYLRNRARSNAEVEIDTEWSQLQKATR